MAITDAESAKPRKLFRPIIVSLAAKPGRVSTPVFGGVRHENHRLPIVSHTMSRQKNLSRYSALLARLDYAMFRRLLPLMGQSAFLI
jgi:hypothetical protein